MTLSSISPHSLETWLLETPDMPMACTRSSTERVDTPWIVKRLSILTPDRRAKLTPLSGTAEVVPVVNRGDPRGFV